MKVLLCLVLKNLQINRKRGTPIDSWGKKKQYMKEKKIMSHMPMKTDDGKINHLIISKLKTLEWQQT